MKRFFTIAVAALLSTTVAASAFAGWGPNGQYGNAVPGSQPVGQSSRPSNHPASAPINTPFDPNAKHGHVPGSFQDKVAKGQIGNGPSSNMGYNPNKPIFTPSGNGGVFVPQSQRPSRERPGVNMNYPSNMSASGKYNQGHYGTNYGPSIPTSQRPSAYNPSKPFYTPGEMLSPYAQTGYGTARPTPPRPYPNSTNTTSGQGQSTWSGYGGNIQTSGYGNHGGGFFGNDVLNRPTNYPQPHYPQKPAPSRPSNYPPAQPQHQYPVGGYGNVGQQMPSTGGYGGGSSWGGYGGSNASQYGMFAR